MRRPTARRWTPVAAAEGGQFPAVGAEGDAAAAVGHRVRVHAGPGSEVDHGDDRVGRAGRLHLEREPRPVRADGEEVHGIGHVELPDDGPGPGIPEGYVPAFVPGDHFAAGGEGHAVGDQALAAGRVAYHSRLRRSTRSTVPSDSSVAMIVPAGLTTKHGAAGQELSGVFHRETPAESLTASQVPGQDAAVVGARYDGPSRRVDGHLGAAAGLRDESLNDRAGGRASPLVAGTPPVDLEPRRGCLGTGVCPSSELRPAPETQSGPERLSR